MSELGATMLIWWGTIFVSAGLGLGIGWLWLLREDNGDGQDTKEAE